MDWRKSSHSGANGGSCVEVAGTAQAVLVRDTKDRGSRTLAFTAEAWRAFAEGLKRSLTPTRTGTLACMRPRPIPAAGHCYPALRGGRVAGLQGASPAFLDLDFLLP